MAHRKKAPSGEAEARADKTCVVCGRRIEWRKKWERDWESVKYCSDACRRTGSAGADDGLEDAIRRLLDSRARESSICPSDVARAVAPDDWRPLMEPVRRAARRLVAAGEAQITQGGNVVDPSTAKGPIRIRRPR
ncbi:hypothetical protein JOE30_003362 [Rhodococcus sp. PvP016]|uniref:DUF2256 and DUF3253 domain-containing protein n=1 Tax=Rhodococcoides corynebacterioides TaxID=53972 RepID=A0ABS2KT29_9NOCA|nr:hypothetical protein [Rhodococcus corynebacterioides]MBP1117565.1 hypothetical protein [Rhodococcus sp. PvP016]